jgi:endonuclease/exonuclease/phosphatase family metal-dependent hydrolase
MSPKKRLQKFSTCSQNPPDVLVVNDNFGEGDTFLIELGILHKLLVQMLGYDARNFSTACDVIRALSIPPVAKLAEYSQNIKPDKKSVQGRNAEIASTLQSWQLGILDQTPVPLLVKDQIRIVYFNAERGREWQKECKILKTHPKLAGASIIFLNEMDSGMARSGNQDTTHQMAKCLQMSYIFGVEFVELTPGQKKEKRFVGGRNNSLGYHGNAILSRFPLKSPQLVRLNGTAEYWGAGGFDGEFRLGDRMALFASVPVVDGSNATLKWLDLVCTHLDYFVNQKTPYNLNSAVVIGRVFKKRQQGRKSCGAIIAGDMGSSGGHSAAVTHWVRESGFQPAEKTNNRHANHANPSGDWMAISGRHNASDPDVFSSNGTSDHNILVFSLVIVC